jgi:MFS family permease
MASAARLAAFWFGLQALWGALLGISLQARTSALHPEHPLIAYGQIATLGALTAMLVQLSIGPLSDRRRQSGGDRRLFLVVGTVLGMAGVIAFYLAPSYGALLAATVFLQFGINIAIGPYQAIIPDYFAPERAGIASSWMAALQSAGNACGALAATLIAPAIGVALALAALLGAGCIITVTHMSRIVPRTVDAARISVPRGAVDLFISRAILWIGFYTILGYMFFYVRDTLHVAAAARVTGIVILIFTISATAGAALAGRPSDRLDRRLVVNIGTAAVAIALVAFALLREVRALYAIAALAGVGWGGFLTADWALGCAILPRSVMATAMGVWNIAVAGSQIIAPALATAALLALRPSSELAPLWAFGLATFEVVLGTAWIWRLPRVARSSFAG